MTSVSLSALLEDYRQQTTRRLEDTRRTEEEEFTTILELHFIYHAERPERKADLMRNECNERGLDSAVMDKRGLVESKADFVFVRN
ncbi:Hypothetical predicted protein [Octopus vulgaris]|uniref:Uncharacterized protein n=1 Tax=Octopus vulgaris TaxID=6645 RepID=A0AA36F147_OCTVU|nr:Hypothetical predicted protein [Octopus vulgaris]